MIYLIDTINILKSYMEPPNYPKEWLNLRLEFKDEYKLEQRNVKRRRKFKKTIDDIIDVNVNNLRINNLRIDNPVSSMKNDYSDTLSDYDEYIKKTKNKNYCPVCVIL